MTRTLLSIHSRTRLRRLASIALIGLSFILMTLATSRGGRRVDGSAGRQISGPIVQADASGTISPSNPTLSYDGGPFANSNPTSPLGMTPPACTPATPCHQFALTVTIPAGDVTQYQVSVNVSWVDPSQSSDYDVYVYQPDATGTQTTRAASSADPEIATFRVPSHTTTNYTIIVVPYSVAPNVPFHAVVNLAPVTLPPPPTGPTPPPGVAIFDNFAPPPGLGGDWGEPSIGVDPKTEKNNNGGTVMTYGGGSSTSALRVTFNDCTSPARALWEATPLITASLPRALSDPILFTDKTTGRTFVSQLNGTEFPNIDYTDNDGQSYTPSQGSGVKSGFDHQTIAAGPFPASSQIPHPLYPNAVYYCSQEDADANCALSIDGGQTFGPAVPMYTANQCVGLHGHVKVAPDGTVYVPNRGCGGLGLAGPANQGLAVSTDAGVTWTVRAITNSKPSSNDPSVAIGQNNTGKPAGQASNTIYFGYAAGDQEPRVAVSHDRGATWEHDQNVGTAFGIVNVAFPTMVAGDDNRASFAFLGTNAPGPGTSEDTSYNGIWHLFVSTTYDGGVTWNTVDVTPNDPVQRSVICLRGTLCASGTRNLLDFIDATYDTKGRVDVIYADGCIGACVNGTSNSGTALATIARQSGGKTLFSAFDPAAPTVPQSPLASAVLLGPTHVHLSWSTPNDGGSPITAYKVYRGTVGVPPALVATLAPTVHTYDQTDSGATFFYYVTAVNAVGESSLCDQVVPGTFVATQNPCTLPGVKVAEDPTGDQTGAPANADLDIQYIAVAEPFFSGGAENLVFTMKVADLSGVILPNRQWRILWTPSTAPSAVEDRYYVGMTSNGAGLVSYEYGTVTSNGNVPTTKGAADAGSYNPDGTIRITLAKSKVGNPPPGDALKTLSGRNFAGTGTATLTKTSATDSTSDVAYALVGNSFCAGVQLGKIASRKTHGAQGTFDIDMPFQVGRGVESRSSGATGDYTMVFTFGNPLTSVQSASVSSGPGSVTSTQIGSDAHELLVNLTGVTSPGKVTVTLSGLVDSSGNATATLLGSMNVLIGDANGDGTVNSADATVARNRSGQLVDGTNFASDINVDGTINSADATMVRNKSGTTIDPGP